MVTRPSISVGALVVMSLLIQACSAPQADPVVPASPRRGEFRVVLHELPASLNPDLGVDEASLVIGRNLFNQLIAVDLDQNIIPDLATRWETSADGRQYTFHLRRGVLWHDEYPFTSDDVRWTFETLRTAGGLAHEPANRIVRIDTPDADTVVFHLKEPWAPFLAELATYGTYVLAEHAYRGADWRSAAANQRPVGTGPFAFSERRADGAIVLVANKRYFGPGPFLERLIFLRANPSDIDDLLLQGQADYTVVRPEVSSLPALQQSTRLVVESGPSDSQYYCAFNLAREPYADVRVRRAINLAIDRLRLVDEALAGYGAPAFTFYTPLIEWAHNPDARIAMTDPAQAAGLLDAAGLRPDRSGVRLTPTLVVPMLSPFTEIAANLRTQLSQVGIALEVVVVAPLDWMARVVQRRDFDLALLGGSQGPDPDNLRVRLSRGQFISYASRQFDEAVDEGARSVVAEDRARAYFRAQAILAEDQPVAPLAEAVRLSVCSRRFVGLPQVEGRGLVAAQDFSLVRLQD